MAITRGWTPCGDASAIVGLFARAAEERLIACWDAADLHNSVIKEALRLGTRLTATCEPTGLVFR